MRRVRGAPEQAGKSASWPLGGAAGERINEDRGSWDSTELGGEHARTSTLLGNVNASSEQETDRESCRGRTCVSAAKLEGNRGREKFEPGPCSHRPSAPLTTGRLGEKKEDANRSALRVKFSNIIGSRGARRQVPTRSITFPDSKLPF